MSTLRLSLAALLIVGLVLAGVSVRLAYLADMADHAEALRRAQTPDHPSYYVRGLGWCDHDWHGRAPSDCPNDSE